MSVKFKIINPHSGSLTINETIRIVYQNGFAREEFAGLDVLMDLDDLKPYLSSQLRGTKTTLPDFLTKISNDLDLGYVPKNDAFCLSNGLSKIQKMYIAETPKYTFVLDMVSDKLSAIDKALCDELELIKKNTPKQSSERRGFKIS